jgi:hypothetical protein
MGRQPYRVRGDQRADRRRHGEPKLDPMALWALAFVVACSLVRVAIAVRQHAFDDDIVLALVAGTAAGWGLLSAWSQRRRGT